MGKPLEVRDLGKKTVIIHGIQTEVGLKAEIHFDEYFELDWDFEPGEKERLQSQIHQGDLTPCWILVRAYGVGCSGDDSLGGVLVAKPEDVDSTIAENSMVNQAVEALKAAIRAQSLELAPYTKALGAQ